MVPRLNQLIEIADVLNEHNDKFDYTSMEITFTVPPSMINKLNEDIYYRNNTEGEPEENIDEIKLNIHGIKFKYETEKSQDD